MSIFKYTEFLTENAIYNMILESRVVYSNDFINMLNRMKGNKLAKKLLSIYLKNIEPLNYNYIDITDQKDAVSFTPDRKVKELNKDVEETWIVIDGQKYLTHSSRNDKIFEKLGYIKEGRECWEPHVGVLGKILSETISTSSGKTYVLFQEDTDGEPKTSVMNKEGLRLSKPNDDKIWKTSRNSIKIGRLVRAILNASKESFTDKDIEDFTNQYKATFDAVKDNLIKFDIVRGKDIAHWYSHDNYYDKEEGTLGSSCMKEVSDEYFDIYVQNIDQVRLVILYDDDGEIVNGRYKSKYIIGRALLWNATFDSVKVEFMDRIYTTADSDVDLFKQFARSNGFWYKSNQNSDHACSVSNGEESRSPTIIIDLESSNFDSYPYVDTVCYLNTDDNKMSNDQHAINADRDLDSTDGGYSSIEEEEDYD